MRIRRYIQGDRKGKEANRIERDAMHDPFLAEALEGYDRVKGNHVPHIKRLRHQITVRNRRRLSIFKYGSIAASLLFLLGFGYYFLQQYEKHQDVVAEMEMIEKEQSLPAPAEPIENAIAQNRLETEEEEDRSIASPSPRQKEKSPVEKPVPPAVLSVTEDSMEEVLMDMQIDQVQMEAESAETPVAVAAAPAARSQRADSNIVREREVQSTKKQADTQHKLLILKISPESVAPNIGQRSYEEYLLNKLSVKDECRDTKGTLEITFHVNKKGKPKDVTIKKSLCPSIDKEAIRLIRKGSDWTPTDKEVLLSISFQ